MPERSDALKRNLKKYFEAGSAISASIAKMSRADLERALRAIAQPGSDAREKVEDTVEEVWARSQRGAEKLLDLVRTEVHRDFERVVDKHRDELADLAERATRLFGAAIGRDDEANEPTTARRPAAKKATAPAKSSPKRAPAKRNSAPRPAAKQASPAKRASTVTKSSTATKAPATKVGVAKKASAAKKAPSAKKRPAPRKAVGGQPST